MKNEADSNFINKIAFPMFIQFFNYFYCKLLTPSNKEVNAISKIFFDDVY